MTCPKCGKEFARLLAVSRRDNSSICDMCGIQEALEDWPSTDEDLRRLIFEEAKKVTQ